MQVLKKIVAFLTLSIAILAFPLAAHAEAGGEAKVKAAAEGTLAKIEEAINIVEKGGNKEDIIKAINDARQLQKEFRYEQTERDRQRANEKLRFAREAFDKDELQPAETLLREALAGFKGMKATYDAAHH